MTKNPLLIAILLTLLTACMSSPEGAPAPQVTVAPEATATSTPPPTETPLPTLTPTPVAVDGIAEDAEGNKLAYLNGEWTVLPKLDAEYAKLMVDGDKLVAVDADGEIAYEYDMAAGSWVEVNTLPDWVRNLESAGNTVDAERGIVYDADGKVLGATGAGGEWTEYPNGMVPLAEQDGSGEPPLEVQFAENFEDAVAMVTKRLPWNNPTVYAKPTAEQAAQAQLRYDRYLKQITEPEGWSPRVRSIEVRLYETGSPKNWVIVYFYERLLPNGRIVTSMNFNTSDRSKVMIFIDTDAVRLVEQLQAGDHGYEIVSP